MSNTKIATRDAAGRWLKGHSPNPKGRPKGYKAMAHAIQVESRNGQELLEFLFDVLRGDIEGGVPLTARMWAAEQLYNRGFGKAPQVIEVGDAWDSEPSSAMLDIAELSDEELETMEAASTIVGRLALKRKPIDV